MPSGRANGRGVPLRRIVHRARLARLPLQYGGGSHYAFPARHPPRSPRGHLRAGPLHPDHRRRRFRDVRAGAAPSSLRRPAAGRKLSRHARRPARAATRAARSRSPCSTPAGTAGIRSSSSKDSACWTRRAPVRLRSCSLPKLEMIVSWTSVPLLELRLKELIVDGPRLAIRRDRSGVLRIAGPRVRSRAGGRRAADHRLDPSPARDRDPRCADRLGRRSAQRAATRARPGPVPSREPVRPSPVRAQGHAAERSRGADRHPRRRAARFVQGLAERARQALRAPRLRRCRSVARVAAAAGPDRLRDGGAARLGRLRCVRNRARSSPTSSSPTSRRRWRRTCRRSSSSICRDASARERTGAQREVYTQALAFTTQDGEQLDPTNFTLSWREGRDEQRGVGAHRIRADAARAARGAERAPAAVRAAARRPRALCAARAR